MYLETYRDLCHGTDMESAVRIKRQGFELRGGKNSWCGRGVYFYDIKKKAWWAANRKCREIKRITGKEVRPAVLFADIIGINDSSILDLRVHKDLCAFEQYVMENVCGFGNQSIGVSDIEDETERIIFLRSALIAFYANQMQKKLVIGNFRQRPQKDHEHAIEFADRLHMIFGIETIYCVKDTTIISNIHEGGTA